MESNQPAKSPNHSGGIVGHGNETYLFINGIKVTRPLQICDYVKLMPAISKPDQESIIDVFKSEIDVGVAALFLRRVSSQLQITSEEPKDLAIRAWNAQWDIVLMSALCDCDADFYFQSNKPVESFNSKSEVRIIHYHLRGLINSIYTLTNEEHEWFERNFGIIRKLIENETFQNAAHCLGTYRWHTLPRARIALLWAGIEGLFNVQSEIQFRLSLLISRFLYPHDSLKMKETFSNVKKLYTQRSKAVHGAEFRDDENKLVKDSSKLLVALLKKCIEMKDLPNQENLIP